MSSGTWPAFNRYLYVSDKQNLGERFRATWPSYLNMQLSGVARCLKALTFIFSLDISGMWKQQNFILAQGQANDNNVFVQ